MIDATPKKIDDVICVILCGGRSRRMGTDKAMVMLNGRPLVSYVLETVRTVYSNILISVRGPSPCESLGLPMVQDRLPVPSPLSGIHAALCHIGSGRLQTVAVDMPLVCPDVLRLLADFDPGADVVVPKIRGQFEPLLAVYSTKCVPAIEALFARGDRKVTGFYRDVRVSEVSRGTLEKVDPGLESLQNINSPEGLMPVADRIKARD